MYNLASQEHTDLWSEDIFILDSGSSGHCHAYNPANHSLAKANGGFYALLGIKYPFICKAKMNKLLYFAVLGRVNQSYVADHTKGFKIYLHEKGEFWPGMEMENIGQTKPIHVPTNTEVRGTFRVVQKINLDKDSDHCVEDTGYSYTKCMKDYVATTFCGNS